MKWLAILAATLLIAGVAGARTDAPEDVSNPDMVKQYLFMPCDALEESYTFIYNELTILTDRMQKCVEFYGPEGEGNSKYPQLMCLYVRMQWEYMYEHIMSIEKAYNVMCQDGERKEPEYEVSF